MKKLFLDDMRAAPDATWDIVRTYKAFVEYIEKNGVPDVISFDHDLAFEHYPFQEPGHLSTNSPIPYDSYNEKTGYHCAQYLVERQLFPRQFRVHSMNPVGKQNIIFLLSKYCQLIR